jgi:hypothetical protein
MVSVSNLESTSICPKNVLFFGQIEFIFTYATRLLTRQH